MAYVFDELVVLSMFSDIIVQCFVSGILIIIIIELRTTIRRFIQLHDHNIQLCPAFLVGVSYIYDNWEINN